MTVLVIVLKVLSALLLSMTTGLLWLSWYREDRRDMGTVSDGWRRRNAPGGTDAE